MLAPSLNVVDQQHAGETELHAERQLVAYSNCSRDRAAAASRHAAYLSCMPAAPVMRTFQAVMPPACQQASTMLVHAEACNFITTVVPPGSPSGGQVELSTDSDHTMAQEAPACTEELHHQWRQTSEIHRGRQAVFSQKVVTTFCRQPALGQGLLSGTSTWMQACILRCRNPPMPKIKHPAPLDLASVMYSCMFLGELRGVHMILNATSVLEHVSDNASILISPDWLHQSQEGVPQPASLTVWA